MSEKYYSLTQLKSIMRTEGNQWTGPYELIYPYDLKKLKPVDVRPVVYCRHCIYDDNCFAQSILEEMSRIPFDKNRFFCADGKRREGGAEG